MIQKKETKKRKKKQRAVRKRQENVVNFVMSHLATPSESEIKYIIKE